MLFHALRGLILLAAAAATLLATAVAGAAGADDPITLIVPYTPGTGIDIVARQLSVQLPKALGRPVVVENVPGASGNIGSERVAHAKPDGNTLLVQVSTLVMNKSLYRKLPYDPVNDFAPVTLTSWGTLLLVVNPAVRKVGTVAQLVQAARAQPGALSYGTPGMGTPHHLAMAMLLQKTGTEMLQVPFKGTGGAVTDLLGGRLDCMFLPVHVALPFIKSGKLVALAASSAKRLPQLPDVPTLAEAGVATGSVDMWYGVLAPKGTPAEVVDRLNREIGTALEAPDVSAAFEAQGMVPAHSTPAAFGELMAKDAARWAEVVRAGRISAE
jgi:tripartite-type tricarboxylate transporter receptor subunit TctC